MSVRTNIFILSDSLNSLSGGAERQIYELVRNLDQEKYKICLGCLSRRDGALDEIKSQDIEVFRFQIDRIYGIKGIWQGFKFARLLKRKKIDVLVTYHFGSDIWGTIFGKMGGVNRIVSNRRDMGFWRNSNHVRAYKFINRWVEKIVVVSKAVKDIVMREEKVSRDKIKVIYNGIDLDRFDNDYSKEKFLHEFNLPDEATVIGCVGNLREVKGHTYLVDAAKTVIDEKSNVHFVLIGRGELQNNLQEQINRLGIQDNVHLLGRRMDVPELLKAMDVCVLPSLSEGLSNTLLEYMACGKPIIATNVGGNPEVITDRSTGLIVEKENSKDLSDNMLYLLERPDESKRFGFNAQRDVTQRFNIHEMLERYEHLLNEDDTIPCVVLGMTLSGLAVARSLGRKGVPVIGVECSDKLEGMYSRYLTQKIVTPRIDTDERGFLKSILDLGKGMETKPVLLATADEYADFISRYRDELSQHYHFIVSSSDTVETFLNKRKTAEFSVAHNINHPYTHYVSNEDQISVLADKLEYPCIIKPQDTHIWRLTFNEQKVIIVHNSEELKKEYAKIKSHGLNVILQQIVTGPDSNLVSYYAFRNNNGEIQGECTNRKIRQYPPGFGVGCLFESKYNERIVQLGRKIVQDADYRGVICLSFKLDEHSNKPYFIEANIRFPLSGQMQISAGLDFPYIAYRYLAYQDQDIGKDCVQKEGIKLLNLILDFGHLIRQLKKKKVTILEWLKGFKAERYAHSNFALDDPKPWCMAYSRFTIMAFKKLFKGLFGRNNSKKSKYIANKRKNVLHFISSNGLFGAEKVALNLCVGLNSNGISSQVSALNNDHNPHLEILDEAKKHDLKTYVIDSKGKFDLSTIGRLRRVIRENNIILLHTHNYKSNMIGLIAGKCEKIPVVATAHGFTDVTGSVSLYEKLDRWFLKSFFNRFVTVTGRMMPEFTGTKRRVIPNGVDFNEFKHDTKRRLALRKRYGIGEDEFLIGSVGRLSREKNHKMLLEAVCSLMKKNDKIKVMIVGDGPTLKELQQFSADHGISDRVIFTGVLEDVTGVYCALDVFVLTSLTEGVPLTLLEAMAANVSVIATRVGGIPDIIKDKHTGLLVDSQDSNMLSKYIEDLMHNHDQRQNLSQSAFDYVKTNYSLKNMCDQYRVVYDEVFN